MLTAYKKDYGEKDHEVRVVINEESGAIEVYVTKTVVDGEPDRILGCPTHMSEYMGNTFSASEYVGILGDFSQYHIVDALSLTIQRLVELYAATNQTGFIGRLETDGMPVLAEAFRRVKLGA